MRCINCGRDLDDNARFCDGCGAPIANPENVQNSVDEVAVPNDVAQPIDTGINQVESVPSNNIVESPMVEPVEPVAPVQQEPPVVTPSVDNPPIYPENNGKKSNNKIIVIIIISIVLIIGIVLSIILLSGNGGKSSNSENNENAENTNNENSENIDDNTENNNGTRNNGNSNSKTESVQEIVEKINNNLTYRVDCSISQEKCLLIFKNGTDKIARLNIGEILYYDENNEIVGIGDASPYYTLRPYEESYGFIEKFKPIKENNNYDHYEIDFSINYSKYINHIKDISYEISKDDENQRFVIKATNNSDDIIDMINFNILYYKDNKLVGLTIYGDPYNLNDKYIEYVKPHESFVYYQDYPTVDGFRGPAIDYDRYEVIVEEAFTYTEGSGLRYRNSHLRED